MKQLLALLILLPSVVYADTVIIDTSNVVTTQESCPVRNKHGFGLRAFATEKGKPTYNACWMKKNDIVYIWYYDMSPSIIAVKSYQPRLESNL